MAYPLPAIALNCVSDSRRARFVPLVESLALIAQADQPARGGVFVLTDVAVLDRLLEARLSMPRAHALGLVRLIGAAETMAAVEPALARIGRSPGRFPVRFPPGETAP